MFNSTQQEPYFINPGCYGDDVCRWVGTDASRAGLRGGRRARAGGLGRRLTRASRWLRPLHRLVTVAAIGGLPLLAAGKAISLPVARILGVSAITLALIGLSVTMTAVAMAARSVLTRSFLVASAACGAVAAGLAGAFGGGELAGREWMSIGTMVAAHGVLMSVGFTLCGLVGHLRLQRA